MVEMTSIEVAFTTSSSRSSSSSLRLAARGTAGGSFPHAPHLLQPPVAQQPPCFLAAGGQQGGRVGKKSRFRGVSKYKKAKTKPWMAEIKVTEDGKTRQIHIGNFAREEDAARAYDRVSIAKLGHAKAETNFPVAEYRAEWAELEALGVDGAVAREKQQGRQD